MPATFYLHGNHDRCEACELRREAARALADEAMEYWEKGAGNE
jgi:hypothetical protein